MNRGGLFLQPLHLRHLLLSRAQNLRQSCGQRRRSGRRIALRRGKRRDDRPGLRGVLPEFRVVGAANFNRQRFFSAGGRKRRTARGGCRRRSRRHAVPERQAHGPAQRGKLCQHARQIGSAARPARRCVQRQGVVFACAQNRVHQPRQARSGAGLEKDPHAGSVHILDAGHEFYRMGELAGEQFARLLRVIRIDLRRAVGKDRHVRLRKFHFGQGAGEGRLRHGHQRAVKRRGDRQSHRVNLPRAQTRGGAFDLPRRAGEHPLGGRVLVGNDQLQRLLLENLFHAHQRRLHGKHGAAVTHRLLELLQSGAGGQAGLFARHEPAPQLGERLQGLRIKAAGGAQGGQLPIAVACGGLRMHAKLLQDAQRPQAHGAQRRLRHLSRAQTLLLLRARGVVKDRVRINKITQARSILRPPLAEDLVCQFQGLQHDRKLAGQIAEHAHVLGALAGE